MIEYTSKYAQGMQLMTNHRVQAQYALYKKSEAKAYLRLPGWLSNNSFPAAIHQKNPIEGTFTTPLSIDTLQTHVKQQVSTKTGKLTISNYPFHSTPSHLQIDI